MKYARLSLADLKDLEKEFIEFLVVNGIEAKDWERIKEEEIEKAEAIIGQFSDVIWEGVLRKIDMVEKRTSNSLTISRIRLNEMETLYFEVDDENIDLMKEESIDKVLSEFESFKPKYNKVDLSYNLTESEYLFGLIRTGFYITKKPEYHSVLDKLSKE